MKILFQILIGIFILVGCQNTQPHKNVVITKADVINPSVDKDTVDDFFNNPLRKINNFDAKIGHEFFDSLYDHYDTDHEITTTSRLNICGGDCCMSYRTFTDKKCNATYYLFKTDLGEYGFSNDQFYISNDTLVMARSFSFDIEEWPTDSTATIWVIKENIYDFNGITATVKTRKKLLKNTIDYTFENAPFTVKSVDDATISKIKMEELKELLTRESLE